MLNRRKFATTIGLGTLALLADANWTAGVAADSDTDLSFVHPELRAYAQAYLKAAAGYSVTADSLALYRKETAAAAAAKPFNPGAFVQEKHIPGPGGAPDVTVYVIDAKPGAARPGILHMHGGGFVLGSARDSIEDMHSVATELGCTTVTVDYRLAPETRYTGSIEDNYAALLWMYRNAKELGVDPSRIAVMGESAGGGHAALLAITARDRGEVPVLFQCLTYPMLDDRTGTTRPPSNSNMGRISWTAASNHFGWESFLGEPPGTENIPAAAAPARVASVAGLPPAFIGVGSIDLFADEDIEYARRLVDGGIQTELMVVPGAFHGFDAVGAKGSFFAMPGGPPPVATNFRAARMDALKRAFARDF